MSNIWCLTALFYTMTDRKITCLPDLIKAGSATLGCKNIGEKHLRKIQLRLHFLSNPTNGYCF